MAYHAQLAIRLHLVLLRCTMDLFCHQNENLNIQLLQYHSEYVTPLQLPFEQDFLNVHCSCQFHLSHDQQLRRPWSLLNLFDLFDPKKIAQLFNEHYAKVGSDIEKKILKPLKEFHHYLRNIQVKDSFFLNPASPQEIFDIILSLDLKKSLGPNSIPIYILKISNNFLSDALAEIINISFKTGIFPDLCKLAKEIPIFKKDDPLLCINYRPISLLSIYSKIFEKLIYSRMYYFLDKNNLIYEKQFRAKHSVNHALISTTEINLN